MTSKRTVLRGVLWAWLVGCATASVRAQVPAGPDVVLVHAFKVPIGESWGPVSINLSSGGWRVGGPDGPLASDGQLRVVLRSLVAAEVGARCTGWVSGATAYPCGFSLREIDLAGAVEARYAAIAVDEQSGVAARDNVGLPGRPEPGLWRHAAIRDSGVVQRAGAVEVRPWQRPGDPAREAARRTQLKTAAAPAVPLRSRLGPGAPHLRQSALHELGQHRQEAQAQGLPRPLGRPERPERSAQRW